MNTTNKFVTIILFKIHVTYKTLFYSLKTLKVCKIHFSRQLCVYITTHFVDKSVDPAHH